MTTRKLTWAVLAVGALTWCGYLAATQKHSPVKRAINERRDERRQQPWQVTFTATREQVMGSLTKTQVTDAGATIMGRLCVYEQTNYPILISAPTKSVWAITGGIRVAIEDISTSGWLGPDPQPDPPGGTLLTFAIYIYCEGEGDNPYRAHEFVYVSNADDDDIERDFSIGVTGRRLWRQESLSTNYGRTQTPAHSGDRALADSWVTVNPASWIVSLGALSWSGTQTWNEGLGEWTPSVSAIQTLIVRFDQHKGSAGPGYLKYAAATGLKWSAANLDFSGMSKQYGDPPPDGIGGLVTGGVGSLELTYNDTAQRTSTWLHGLPLIPDFTRLAIRRREGSLLSGARLNGPWQASLEVPDSLNWSAEP